MARVTPWCSSIHHSIPGWRRRIRTDRGQEIVRKRDRFVLNLDGFDPEAVERWVMLLIERAGRALPEFVWNTDDTPEQILFRLAAWLGLDAESLSRRLSRVPVRFEDAAPPRVTPAQPAGGARESDVPSVRGRNVFAAVGIDRYWHWSGLRGPVEDVVRVTALFRKLGFTLDRQLLDESATRKAIQRLVAEQLAALGSEDSLVLFYAGRTAMTEHRVQDRVLRHGYLIPADAQQKEPVSSWIDLEEWLRMVSVLPAKHILVILDVYGTGLALDSVVKWRDVVSDDSPVTGSSPTGLEDRKSRRVITSGLEHQERLEDRVSGGSLFTSCLIDALDGGLARQIDGSRRTGTPYTTGSELGLYLQQCVSQSSGSRQTPDFGTFALDDRGELFIPLLRK